MVIFNKISTGVVVLNLCRIKIQNPNKKNSYDKDNSI